MSPSARPAQPILASTLLATSPSPPQNRPYTGATTTTAPQCETNAEPPRKKQKLKTGLGTDVDDGALRGGLDYGRGGVCGVAVAVDEDGVGEIPVYLHVLASHLLSDARARAHVIDTHGALDLRRLKSMLVAGLAAKANRDRRFFQMTKMQREQLSGSTDEYGRFTGRPGLDGEDADLGGSESEYTDTDADAGAEDALGRLSIMRVFDFEGVVEAVGEVAGELARLAREHEGVRDSSRDEYEVEGDDAGGEVIAESEQVGRTQNVAGKETPKGSETEQRFPTKRARIERGEIPDSEDEDEDEGEDAMPSSPTPSSPTANKVYSNDTERKTHTNDQLDSPPEPNPNPEDQNPKDHPPSKEEDDTQPPVLVLLHPFLTPLTQPLMSANHTTAHSTLTTLQRHLHALTRTYPSLAVVLFENTVECDPFALRTSREGGEEKRGRGEGGVDVGKRHALPPREVEMPSAFMDIAIRPATRKTFAWGLDVSLMVWRAGRLKSSGGGGSSSGDVNASDREKVVVEVLGDRFGGRGGSWGVVSVDDSRECKRVDAGEGGRWRGFAERM